MLLIHRAFSGQLWLLFFIAIISACQHEADKLETVGHNKFADPVLTRIYEYQDRRATKELLAFFDDEKPAYREAAALAFGSVQDTSAIPPLALLLNDDAAKVRRAAAYALGQMHDTLAIMPLSNALAAEDSTFVRKELMEALGKVITMDKIRLLLGVRIGSDQEKEGLAWGLYRAGIRNVHDGVCMDVALSLLDTTHTYETRLGATHFFSRSPNINLVGREGSLIRLASIDPAPDVRMAAALALRKAPTSRTGEALIKVISNDHDYRVRINSIRAMETLEFAQTQSRLWELLNDENVNVGITAAELLAERSSQIAIEKVIQIENWRVKSILLGGAVRTASEPEKVIGSIRQEFEGTSNVYYKAGLLRAAGHSVAGIGLLKDKVLTETLKPVQTAGIEALINIRTSKNFPVSAKKEFALLFKEIIRSGDVGAVALISTMFLMDDLGFKDSYQDHGFLLEAKAKLSLPKDNEALQPLNKVIARFKGEEMPETKNAFNYPIDWVKVKEIKKDQKMIIRTEQGDVTLRLLVEEAPGSVLNFLSLADSGYYNGKNFHRIVPNFVVQGGCNRGDGYGGEDHSIRSEFGLKRYRKGAIGMASAGKDTEGTQWFITHSPTPHLDGRYTLFAQVEDGMEAVHRMEAGNKIIEIKRVD